MGARKSQGWRGDFPTAAREKAFAGGCEEMGDNGWRAGNEGRDKAKNAFGDSVKAAANVGGGLSDGVINEHQDVLVVDADVAVVGRSGPALEEDRS